MPPGRTTLRHHPIQVRRLRALSLGLVTHGEAVYPHSAIPPGSHPRDWLVAATGPTGGDGARGPPVTGGQIVLDRHALHAATTVRWRGGCRLQSGPPRADRLSRVRRLSLAGVVIMAPYCG